MATPNPTTQVTVDDCRRLCQDKDKDLVICLTIDRDGRACLTTYGRNANLCRVAAHFGDVALDAIDNERDRIAATLLGPP